MQARWPSIPLKDGSTNERKRKPAPAPAPQCWLDFSRCSDCRDSPAANTSQCRVTHILKLRPFFQGTIPIEASSRTVILCQHELRPDRHEGRCHVRTIKLLQKRKTVSSVKETRHCCLHNSSHRVQRAVLGTESKAAWKVHYPSTTVEE